MAYHTIEDGPWPKGTTVSVWPTSSVSGGVPSGSPVDTAVADPSGTATFAGLTEGGSYTAFGHGGSQVFEAVNQEQRISDLEESLPTRRTGTGTWNTLQILNGATETTFVAIDGAEMGDPVTVGFTALPSGAIIAGSVVSPGAVGVTIVNHSGSTINPLSGTVRATVEKWT